MIVVSSDMIATEPIPDRLREIGWTGGEGISDARLMVHYHQTTHDGRIAIGRGSGKLAFSNHITAGFHGSPSQSEVVEQGFRKLYPNLNDVAITHRWGGPIDRSRSGTLLTKRSTRETNSSTKSPAVHWPRAASPVPPKCQGSSSR